MGTQSESETSDLDTGRLLILMRHAKSDWSDSSLSDHDRPLNSRGQRDAPRMANWLAESDWIPDVVLSSDDVPETVIGDVNNMTAERYRFWAYSHMLGKTKAILAKELAKEKRCAPK